MAEPRAGEWWIVEDPVTKERTVSHCVHLKVGGLAWERMDYIEPLPFDRCTPVKRVEMLREEGLNVSLAIKRLHDEKRVGAVMAGIDRLNLSFADLCAIGSLCLASALQLAPEEERIAYVAGIFALVRERMETMEQEMPVATPES